MTFLYPLDPKYIRPDNIAPTNKWNSNGGRYGWVRDNGTKYHAGVDYKAPIGSNVYSAGSGKIIYSGYNNSYGNCVIIKHYDGTSTLYAHMKDKPLLKAGDSVVGRIKLGEVGKTGNAVGKDIEPHLHFEYLNEEATEEIVKNTTGKGGSIGILGIEKYRKNPEENMPNFNNRKFFRWICQGDSCEECMSRDGKILNSHSNYILH